MLLFCHLICALPRTRQKIYNFSVVDTQIISEDFRSAWKIVWKGSHTPTPIPIYKFNNFPQSKMIHILLLTILTVTQADHAVDHSFNDGCSQFNNDGAICIEKKTCKWSPDSSQCLQKIYRTISAADCNEGSQTQHIATMGECLDAMKHKYGANNVDNVATATYQSHNPLGCYLVLRAQVAVYFSKASSGAACTATKPCLCAVKDIGNNQGSGHSGTPSLSKTDPTCATKIPSTCQSSSSCEWKNDRCISFIFTIVKTGTCQGNTYVTNFTSFYTCLNLNRF